MARRRVEQVGEKHRLSNTAVVQPVNSSTRSTNETIWMGEWKINDCQFFVDEKRTRRELKEELLCAKAV